MDFVSSVRCRSFATGNTVRSRDGIRTSGNMARISFCNCNCCSYCRRGILPRYFWMVLLRGSVFPTLSLCILPLSPDPNAAVVGYSMIHALTGVSWMALYRKQSRTIPFTPSGKLRIRSKGFWGRSVRYKDECSSFFSINWRIKSVKLVVLPIASSWGATVDCLRWWLVLLWAATAWFRLVLLLFPVRVERCLLRVVMARLWKAVFLKRNTNSVILIISGDSSSKKEKPWQEWH